MNVRRLTLLVLAAVLWLQVAGCADQAPSASSSEVESPTPTPAAPPDLTEELIAKHATGQVRWAREDELVTFPDGSWGVLSRSGEVPVLTVSVDGSAVEGEVPDHHAEGGLAPAPLDLDSGRVGYVVHQGGGEFAAMNLMVVHDDELVSVGQACYDLEADAYRAC